MMELERAQIIYLIIIIVGDMPLVSAFASEKDAIAALPSEGNRYLIPVEVKKGENGFSKSTENS